MLSTPYCCSSIYFNVYQRVSCEVLDPWVVEKLIGCCFDFSSMRCDIKFLYCFDMLMPNARLKLMPTVVVWKELTKAWPRVLCQAQHYTILHRPQSNICVYKWNKLGNAFPHRVYSFFTL